MVAPVVHWYDTCDWMVLTWKIFFYSCLVGDLSADVSSDWFVLLEGHSIFFASCLTLLARNLSRSILLSLMVLDTNSSSFEKTQKMSWCQMFAVSCGYLARHTWACTALYNSSTDLLPWWKLVSRSNLALTSFAWCLQKYSYLDQIVSKLSSSVDKHHEAYWSIPKSSLHAIPFLHFLDSESIAYSQSTIFSHFSFHFRNLEYKPPLTVQSISGPSMYGIYMCGTNCVCLVDGCCSSSCISVSWLELEVVFYKHLYLSNRQSFWLF